MLLLNGYLSRLLKHNNTKRDITVIVCGGREYNRQSIVFSVLDAIHKKYNIVLLKHGGASGADALGGKWAKQNGVLTEEFEALWKEKGKAAGPIRNMVMAQSGADICLVFPGTVGTANMMKCAKECNIPIINVDGSEF